MAYMSEGLILPFLAGGAISAGMAVKMSASGTVVVTAAITDACIGIAKNTAGSGDTVSVQVYGVSKALTNTSAVLVGSKVACGAAGVVALAATGSVAIGVALEANGGAAVYIPVLLGVNHAGLTA